MAAPKAIPYPHIVRNPDILAGEPTIAGTRIAVRNIVEAARHTRDIEEYGGPLCQDTGMSLSYRGMRSGPQFTPHNDASPNDRSNAKQRGRASLPRSSHACRPHDLRMAWP